MNSIHDLSSANYIQAQAASLSQANNAPTSQQVQDVGSQSKSTAAVVQPAVAISQIQDSEKGQNVDLTA